MFFSALPPKPEIEEWFSRLRAILLNSIEILLLLLTMKTVIPAAWQHGNLTIPSLASTPRLIPPVRASTAPAPLPINTIADRFGDSRPNQMRSRISSSYNAKTL
jgi:hypothetical protein